jgi:hypothetical protein
MVQFIDDARALINGGNFHHFPFLEPNMITEGGSISILTQILEYTSDRKYLKPAWRFVSTLLM